MVVRVCRHVWRRRRAEGKRPGAVIVELALVLPLVVFLILATIDTTTAVFLDHSLTIAAYEGARIAVRPDGNSADTLSRSSDFLSARAVAGGNVSVSPSNVDQLEQGTPITVTTQAPCDPNMLIPSLFFGGRTLTATCTMVKE